MSSEEASLLLEQEAFYRRRAPDYDDWWQRRGRYDRGPDEAAAWAAEVAEVEAALESFGATGEVLELAGGTGWWTEKLARTAGHLTVVDASPEVIELNRRRVQDPDVDYVLADLFAGRPRLVGRADVVFFSFWLSHVPLSRFASFWATVAEYLAPAGRVFFADSRRDPTATRPDPYVVEEQGEVQRRRLADGSEHRVVKVFHDPERLAGALAELGWQAEVRRTARSFIYGTAGRRAG